jgi:hypothetical protein
MAVDIIPFENHERFLKFISVNNNGCWEWNGFIDKHGYGKFTLKNKCYFSHRVSFDIFVKKLNKELVIDHICKNRKCCNPEHLREVTAKINVTKNSESFVAYNKKKTHCPKGHELVYPNIYSHDGRRRCKICNLSKAKERRNARKS